MATIFVNGCFDILHQGHKNFLSMARALGYQFVLSKGELMASPYFTSQRSRNRLVVAVNSDESARRLKHKKWGEKYPLNDLETRLAALEPYADIRRHFTTESELEELIWFYTPCIICKGPDYAGKRVTGDLIAPVVILDTPEPEFVKLRKIELYGQVPK